MKLNVHFFINILVQALFMALLCGFQTSLWYQFFGNVPAPLLWVNLIVYIALYRKPFMAIWVIYALGFIAASFSALPLKMMFVTLFILFALIFAIKSRVFWSGSGYYTIMSIFAAVAFHVIYFLLSLMLEPNSASLQPMERLVQIILTPSFAFPMYWLLARIDRWTHCEILQESGGVEL